MHTILKKTRVIVAAAITFAIVAGAAPAAVAHQVDEGPYAGTYPHATDEWFSAWLHLVREVGGLTPDLIALRAALYDADADAAAAEAIASVLLPPDDLANSVLGTGVDRWRPLVALYFEPQDVRWALDIIRCESGGNPNARSRRSSARGLFQHLGKYWPQRSRRAGWEGASIFDPEANVAVAAWLFYTQGGKKHWTCKA